MTIGATVKNIIKEKGLSQKWVAERMNRMMPGIAMNSTKLSAVVHGNRKLTGDEFIAFCKAVDVSPDVFILS